MFDNEIRFSRNRSKLWIKRRSADLNTPSNSTKYQCQIALASALTVAMTGLAMAKLPPVEAVTQVSLPYFSAPQDVYGRPLGRFAFNTHVCLTGQTYTWNRMQFFQYVLPNGELVYTLVGRGIFIKAPEGNGNCEAKVSSVMISPSITAPIAPPVQNTVTPSQGSSPNQNSTEVENNTTEQSGSSGSQTAGRLAVIAIGSVPYYKVPLSNVGTVQPLGYFQPNEHLCTLWESNWNGRRISAFNIPGTGLVLAAYSQQTFSRDLAHVCRLAVPDSVTDPEMRSDIQEVDQFYSTHAWDQVTSQSYPSDDPRADRILTKLTIAEYFLNKTHYITPGGYRPNDEDVAEWSSDKSSYITVEDITKARRWYQMALNQGATGTDFNKAQDGLVSCNKILQDKEARIADEKSQLEENQQISATVDTSNRVILRWKPDNKKDPLSGQVTLQVSDISVKTGTGESIDAFAYCSQDNVAIKFSVFQNSNLKALDLNVENGNTAVEEKIGDQNADTVYIQPDYTNGLITSFSDSDLSIARNIGVELTLSDGNQPVFDINPQDPVLKALVLACSNQNK